MTFLFYSLSSLSLLVLVLNINSRKLARTLEALQGRMPKEKGGAGAAGG